MPDSSSGSSLEKSRLLEIAAGILADLQPLKTGQKRQPPEGTWETSHRPHGCINSGRTWAKLRPTERNGRSSPLLVQCITNAVAMDLTANVLLACRCSPAMVSDASEAADFAARCGEALLVNVGTLSPGALAGARAAAAAANRGLKPWVLDPVGMGATAARSAAILDLVKLNPAVIKANGSEMIALAKALGFGSGAGAAAAPRGVDCAPGVTAEARAFAAASVARGCRCVTVVTGATDYIFWPETETREDRKRFECLAVASGSALQLAVTAMGCALGGLVAAFLGASRADECDPDSLEVVAKVTTAAVAAYGAAAVIAERSASGPGSFRAAFIDALWNLTAEEVNSLGRVSLRVAEFHGAAPPASAPCFPLRRLPPPATRRERGR